MKKLYVPPTGNPSATLACCGEQPDTHEIRARPPKPFVGPAGQGLDQCLAMTKILRRDLYLTNVIKDLDHPLKHYIDIGTHGKVTVSMEGHQYIRPSSAQIRKKNN